MTHSVLQMIHWNGPAHPSGWRGLLSAASLALLLHLGLFWSMGGESTPPHTQTAQQISMTLLTMAANSAGRRTPEPVAEPRPEPRPTPEPKPAEPITPPAPAVESVTTPAPDEVAERPRENTPEPQELQPQELSGATASAQQAVPDSEPDHSAAFLNNAPPHYPNAARRRGIEGRVLLNVEVLASGRCGRIELLTGSGHDMLDHEAISTVKNWRFIPAKRAGFAIDRWYQVPVTFRLRNR